jgi:hypothetical protein
MIRNILAGTILTAVTLVITIPAYAEQSLMNSNGSGNSILSNIPKAQLNLKSWSLLDPSRFSMKQQSVVSYSSSGSYGSNMLGMYINTMEYRFAMPLTMRLKVAYQNNMGSLLGNKSSFGDSKSMMETGNLFIPAFDLIYKPWKNTIISFHYRDYSNSNSYGGGYGGYGYSPYGGYSSFMR